MAGVFLVLATLQLAGDTVTLDVASALQRGLEASSSLAATRYRADAASDRAAQATAWPNPRLGISAENVGQQSAFTGLSGAAGLEGQAVLSAPLLLGGRRSGPIRVARADESATRAGLEAGTIGFRMTLLQAIGSFLRDQGLADSARDELETIERIAGNLALQAEAGRAARGDAARAELARGMAATRLARREAILALDGAELARLLGYPPTTAIRVASAACSSLGDPLAEAGAEDPPELRIAQARVDAARGSVDAARGARLPQIDPQLGVRRSGGNTGLFLGFTSDLPLFDLGARRVAAARADESAALANLRDAEERWASARAGGRNALAAIDRAGAGFDASWFDSVEQAVTAAQARFELGESTLAQLLDTRRARLQALDDYATWQAEWWAARTEVARLEGLPIEGSLVCEDPFRENAR